MFGRLIQSLRSRLPINPRSYWESRHKELKGQLSAPGHLGLDEQENLRNYEDKRQAIQEVLEVIVADREAALELLDAGCGTGAFFQLYQSLGFNVTGVDFSKSALIEAGRYDGVKLILGDLKSIDTESRFNVIASIDVLFHVLKNEDWLSFLSCALGLLATDGRIVIQEHLVPEEKYEGVSRHVHFRTLRQYEEALTEVGLKIHRHVTYELPVEGVSKDILVISPAEAD